MESEEDLSADDKQELVRQFEEVTKIQDSTLSSDFLTNHNWKLDAAINGFFQSSQSPEPTVTGRNLRTTVEQNAQRSVVPRSTRFLSIRWLRIPFEFIFNLIRRSFWFLPRNFLNVALTFFRKFFIRNKTRTPIDEIEAFLNRFDQIYGTEHPPFYRGIFSQALRDAQTETRILFVYLHDEKSMNSDRFVREIISGQTLREQIGNNLFWATTSSSQQGTEVSRILNVRNYPCFCIIAHYGSQQTVLLKIERYHDHDETLAKILDGIQQADQSLDLNRSKKSLSEQRRKIVEEQDEAYELSLNADREKAQKKLTEENERRKIEAEKEQKEKILANFREKLREKFVSETIDDDEENLVEISIRLPSDEVLCRKFKRDDSFRKIFEFAWTHDSVPEKFVFLWDFPRKRHDFESIGDSKISDFIKEQKRTFFLEKIDEEI